MPDGAAGQPMRVGHRQAEAHARAGAGAREPDPTTVGLDDCTRDREGDARAARRPRPRSEEGLEEPRALVGGDRLSRVGNLDLKLSVACRRAR
jgi:hypothetical protein